MYTGEAVGKKVWNKDERCWRWRGGRVRRVTGREKRRTGHCCWRWLDGGGWMRCTTCWITWRVFLLLLPLFPPNPAALRPRRTSPSSPSLLKPVSQLMLSESCKEELIDLVEGGLAMSFWIDRCLDRVGFLGYQLHFLVFFCTDTWDSGDRKSVV